MRSTPWCKRPRARPFSFRWWHGAKSVKWRRPEDLELSKQVKVHLTKDERLKQASPVRLDYFGDDVESLREFAPATQLSTGQVGRVEVYPCRELVITEDVRRRADLALNHYRGHYAGVLERLAQGAAFEGMEQTVPLIYERLPMLADLLPPAGWIVVATARRTADRAARILEEADALAEASAWPGPRSVRELEASLSSMKRRLPPNSIG